LILKKLLCSSELFTPFLRVRCWMKRVMYTIFAAASFAGIRPKEKAFL